MLLSDARLAGCNPPARVANEGSGSDRFTVAHHNFIRRFIKARKNEVNDLFWGYAIGNPGSAPTPGDLIVYARFSKKDKRSDAEKWVSARGRFDLDDNYDSHTDVVVEVRPGEMDVIGANVENSVTMKTLTLSPEGHLIDTHYYWFATLKFQGH
ncbi:DUF2272 domain-containing protein [Pseudomonas sp. Ma2-10]